MTIGQRIREARKNAGLTQRELAEKSGTATGTIQQYELGKRRPRLEQLQRIADTLDVSVGYLQGYESMDLKKLVDAFTVHDYRTMEQLMGLPEGSIAPIPPDELRSAAASTAPSTLDRRQAEISSANQLLKALVDQYEGNLENLLDGISRLSVEEREALHDASLTLLVALRTGEATVGKPVATRTGGPQTAPALQEGKDATPTPAAPEAPPEDE